DGDGDGGRDRDDYQTDGLGHVGKTSFCLENVAPVRRVTTTTTRRRRPGGGWLSRPPKAQRDQSPRCKQGRRRDERADADEVPGRDLDATPAHDRQPEHR